jgi:hypothetical protein
MKKISLISIILFVLCISFVSGNVFINEFQARPYPNDVANRWIELYYNGSETINLSNWKINDSDSNGNNLIGTLNESQRYVVFNGSQFDFTLELGGQTLYLYEDNILKDTITYDAVPISYQNTSRGRIHDGLETWINFTSPTPNVANNRLPIGTIGNKTTNEDTNYFFDITNFITDLDNDSLTFTIVDENVSEVDCNIINETNITLNPATNWNGNANCTIEIDDIYGKINKTFNINVASVNDAPEVDLSPLEGSDIDEDSSDEFNLSNYVTDVENDEINWSCMTNETDVSSLVNNVTKMLNISAMNDFYGDVNVTCTADDGMNTTQDSFMINVQSINDAPWINITEPQPYVWFEDREIVWNLTDLGYIGDIDNELSALLIDSDSPFATIENQVIKFNFTNDALKDLNTLINVTVNVSDNQDSDEQNLTFNIINTNDVTVMYGLQDKQATEGINLTFLLDSVDIDPTNDTLIYDRNNSFFGRLNITPINRTTSIAWFIPDYEDVGVHDITFNVTDGFVNSTDSKNMTITVGSLLTLSNLVITIDDKDFNVNEEDTVGPALPDSSVSLSVDITNNYPEPSQWVENLTLMGTISSELDGISKISHNFVLNGSKTATRTLNFGNLELLADESNKYNLTLVAKGKDFRGVSRKIEWVVYINYTTESVEVRIVNPILEYDNLSCYRGDTINLTLVNTGETDQYDINLTVSNSDLGIYYSELRNISSKQYDQERTYPISIINSTVGTYPINMKIVYDNGDGGYTTKEKEINLTINECLDIQDKQMLEDTADVLEINLSELVNDPIQPDSYFDYGIEQTNEDLVNCTVSGQIITCVDTKEDDQVGSSDITVNVSKDPYYNYNTFTITVTEENDPPVAYDVVSTTNEDTSVLVEFNCSDPEGNTLNYVIVSDPSNGVLSGSGSSRTYEPDQDYNGADSFTYKCNDNMNNSNVANVYLTINSVDDLPYINDSSPTQTSFLIGDGVNQELKVNVLDPDNLSYQTKWYINGVFSGITTDSFDFSESNTGIYVVLVNVTNTSETQSYGTKTWTIEVATTPQTSYSGTINDVNDSNVNAFTGLTIYNGNVKIDFGNEVMDLSDVVDVDTGVRLDNGVVGINSDATGFNVFKNHHAIITMYNLNSKNTPKIYYNGGFSATGTSECTASTNPACTDISYSSGILTFKVSHFSIFFIEADNSAPGTGALELDIDVDEDEPKPDEYVEITVDIENTGDLDIEDIELKIELKDKEGDVVEDEDGDDLEDDEEFDLDEGDDDSFTFKFKIPSDAEDGEEYTIYVEACGEDENGNEECVIDTSQTIKVEREKHEVEIFSAVVSPSTISCYDSFDISVGVKNIGQKNEDVRIVVTNSELGISASKEVELEAEDADDYKATVGFAFAAPSDLKEGIYPIKIEAKYGDEVETKTLSLTKTRCSITMTNSDDEVIVTNPVVITSQPVDVTSTKITGATTAKFSDSFEYMILLIILSILALGAIIFLIGAVIIKY